jgi:DNA replication protein DnaC
MIAMTIASLVLLLRALKLPTMARHADEVAQLAEREGWTFVHYLHHLVELEVHERRRRRIARNLKDAALPPDKTLATLNRARLPAKVAKALPTLCEGAFVERGDNLLAFGLPGRGKTHLVCAIGYELIQRGHRVLFTPTYALVQRLLAAKRELRLEQELALLDRVDAVILDDIGYVQQSRDEMEVLFTFLAERYERRTVMITSNLVFSEWDRIFKDPMTTAAAIDRLVHHAVILELIGTSARVEHAQAARTTTPGGTTPSSTEPSTTPPLDPIPSAAPTPSGPASTTTTPTATTPGAHSPRTPSPITSSPTTTSPLPGAAPTAPGPANPATAHPSTKGDPTTKLKKTQNRTDQTEADGEM